MGCDILIQPFTLCLSDDARICMDDGAWLARYLDELQMHVECFLQQSSGSQQHISGAQILKGTKEANLQQENDIECLHKVRDALLSLC